jgi:hypothetical protein
MAAAGLVILMIAWVVLLIFTFRTPAPQPGQLLSFLFLVLVTIALAYLFAIRVLRWDPIPPRVSLGRTLADDRFIDLATVVPGVQHPTYIHRIDTDWDEEEIKEEWLVFYQYDSHQDQDRDITTGPFGGAIYDYDRCRPPVIHSFELVPVNYEYLGEDWVNVSVENIIEYEDPLSQDQLGMDLDRPEVIINGISRGAVTDLNIFRKIGWDADCIPRRESSIYPEPEQGVIPQSPRQIVTVPFIYDNIGSFRGSYRVERNGATVTVKDRAGFERSQIVVYRRYTPKEGSYFQPYTVPEVEPGPSRLLVEPDEVGLTFGPARPDEIRQVYYPEKTVLAFFLDLGPDPDTAMSYLCESKGRSQYRPEDFGLTLPLNDLAKVVVCELAYNPDVLGEQNHEDQFVYASVVEVAQTGGSNDCAQAQKVRCRVVAQPNPSALPYGCEWCISECVPVP